MSYLIKPAGYKALLNLSQTEMGIKKIKDFFQQNLSSELRLRRVTAPLFVLKWMGINDDLNGTERAVTFPIKDLDDAKAEIVHSLAQMETPYPCRLSNRKRLRYLYRYETLSVPTKSWGTSILYMSTSGTGNVSWEPKNGMWTF